MSPTPTRLVGIAWYRMDRYARAIEAFSDGIAFPKTHAAWRQKAVRMERELKRQGSVPVRIEIDPDAFVAWCAARGLAPDSVARNRFIAETVDSMAAKQRPAGD
ncbi:MAG: hypothetical protein AB7G13_10670 [Lautropia sp.]